jgi:acrylyl-CoA reductase (NADPH)
LGSDSSRVPKPKRREIWARIMRDLPMDHLDPMIQVEPLSKIFELGELILAGKIRGRTVIDIKG